MNTAKTYDNRTVIYKNSTDFGGVPAYFIESTMDKQVYVRRNDGLYEPWDRIQDNVRNTLKFPDASQRQYRKQKSA